MIILSHLNHFQNNFILYQICAINNAWNVSLLLTWNQLHITIIFVYTLQQTDTPVIRKKHFLRLDHQNPYSFVEIKLLYFLKYPASPTRLQPNIGVQLIYGRMVTLSIPVCHLNFSNFLFISGTNVPNHNHTPTAYKQMLIYEILCIC